MNRIHWDKSTTPVLVLLALLLAMAAPPAAVAAPRGVDQPATGGGEAAWTLTSLSLPPWLGSLLGSVGIGWTSASAGADITVGGVAMDSDFGDARQAELRLQPPATEEVPESEGGPNP